MNLILRLLTYTVIQPLHLISNAELVVKVFRLLIISAVINQIIFG